MTINELLKEHGVSEIIGYSRKSRGDDDDLSKHRDSLTDFANELNLPLTIYEEIGSSEILNRPKLNEIREKIKRKEIRCICVLRLDRLSRKITDLERLLKEFQFHDVVLLEAHRKKVINYDDALAHKLESIMDDLYQEAAKKVLTSGKRRAVELYGRHQGPVPLGYTYNKASGILEICEKTSPIVKYIFDHYIAGDSAKKIAIDLNQQGYKTSTGNHFTTKSIWDILRNEKYIGTQIHGKKQWFKDENGKKMSKDSPREKWIIHENAHEPIIDNETFDRAQITIENNRTVPVKSRARTYPLSNLVRCSKCGNSHSFYIKDNGKTYMKPCQKVDYVTGNKCKNGAMPVEDVESFIKKKIMKEIRPAFREINEKIAKSGKIDLSSQEKQLKDLYKQRRNVEKQINNLLDLQIQRGVDERLILKEKELTLKLNNIYTDITDLEENKVDKNDWMDVFMMLNEPLDLFVYEYLVFNNSKKNKLLSKYVDHVVYNKEPFSLEIVYTKEVQELLELK
jgi:site-specific DNA recombinase